MKNQREGLTYWHSHIQVGDNLRISYPKNHFPLSFHAKRHIFYAAGIGITPFMTMMEELKEKRVPFQLHYGAKSKKDCAFYDYIKSEFGGQTVFYFSQEPNGKRMDTSSLWDHPIGTHVYFCGPHSFTSAFEEEANRISYPKKSIHIERFSPQLPINPLPFIVEIEKELVCVRKEESILDALLRSGVNVPYSCMVGRCGTCEMKVMNGEVAHYDSFLSEEQKKANSVILTCVSRAKTGKLIIAFK